MTSLRRAFPAALLCAALFAAAQAARAQEAQARPESKRLAVQVVNGRYDRGLIFAVPEGQHADGLAAEFDPPRRTGAQPPGRPPLTRIRMRLSYEGGAVRVRVAAVFDDSYPAEAPGPKYGAREQEVASLLAREGETVTAGGLKRFGFEPLVLKVVRYEPGPEMPPLPAPPRAVNRLRSIEVVSFAVAGAQLDICRATLLNVSSKNIVALEVSVPDRGLGHTVQAAGGRALMPPGGTYQVELNFGRGGTETAHGYLPEPPPDALTVETVVFEDGSYEGEAKSAARMVARQRGRLVQFARVLRLVQSALDAGVQGGPDALAALKARAAGLRIDAEPELLDELMSKFPELSHEEGRGLVASAALEGLRNAREEFLRLVREVEAGPGLRLKLEEVRAKVEKRAGAGRD